MARVCVHVCGCVQGVSWEARAEASIWVVLVHRRLWCCYKLSNPPPADLLPVLHLRAHQHMALGTRQRQALGMSQGRGYCSAQISQGIWNSAELAVSSLKMFCWVCYSTVSEKRVEIKMIKFKFKFRGGERSFSGHMLFTLRPYCPRAVYFALLPHSKRFVSTISKPSGDILSVSMSSQSYRELFLSTLATSHHPNTHIGESKVLIVNEPRCVWLFFL